MCGSKFEKVNKNTYTVSNLLQKKESVKQSIMNCEFPASKVKHYKALSPLRTNKTMLNHHHNGIETIRNGKDKS